MNKVTTIGSIVSLMTVLSSVRFADAPAVDATATPQTAVAQSSGRHHWYDGPLTQNAPQQPAVAQVPMATSADAQSELVLPSVSSVQSDSGVTPTLAATDAVELPQPPVQALPPVENLSETSVSSVTPPPEQTIHQTSDAAYPTHSSAWPAQQAASHQSITVSPAASDSSALSQQVRRLNQQLQNLIAMNLPQQVADMQQQIQQLTGLLEEEQHEIAALKEQQKVYYKDLDARITQGSSQSDTSMTSVAAGNSNAQTMTDVAEYQRASQYLSNKQYDQARSAYQQYLTDYPKGQFVANAHYWLGELNLLKKNNAAALSEFSTVVKQYPSSSKRPDAEYKIASIQMNTGHVADAKQGFQAIQKHYPKSTAAQLAAIQLKKIAVIQSG